MNPQLGPLPVTVSPDARAYLMLLLAFSPLFLLWGLGWWRNGSVNSALLEMIVAVCLVGMLVVWNRTVRIGLADMSQGIPPFRTRIAFGEIDRIHNIYIPTRYAATHCLAVSTASDRQRLVLPMKSFGAAKRKMLVEIVQAKAPQVRVDAACLRSLGA